MTISLHTEKPARRGLAALHCHIGRRADPRLAARIGSCIAAPVSPTGTADFPRRAFDVATTPGATTSTEDWLRWSTNTSSIRYRLIRG